MTLIEQHDRLTLVQQSEVRTLAGTIAGECDAPPLNDQSLAQLGDCSDGLVHVTANAGPELVGYAQLVGNSAELATREPLVEELLQAVEGMVDGPLTLWTHGKRSPIVPALQTRAYRQTRVLHQLRMALDAPIPEVPVAAGIDVRPFVIGRDEDRWVRVNAAAFAEHAEQGQWTLDDVAARELESWFEPAGFFLAWRGPELLGFHWTKQHPDGNGEVYVLGVTPEAQGLRLGAALLSIGLRHLADSGCPQVLLYVDESNSTALRLYERFGFQRYDVDAQWSSPSSPAVQPR